MQKYERMLDGPGELRNTNARLAGLAFGYSLCIRFIYHITYIFDRIFFE
jgi:hypothetical protein